MSSATIRKVLAVVVLLAAGMAFMWWRMAPQPVELPPQVQTQQPEQSSAAAGEVEPRILYPVPAPPEASVSTQTAEGEAQQVPPPGLEQGDSLVGSALDVLLDRKELSDLLVVKDVVRRIVVTVDNLPGEQLPWGRSPIKRADGSFEIDKRGDEMTISANNAARYQPYVRLAEAVDSASLVGVYTRLYPLFQAAYDELGYPNAYFNDRLVAVIDHMLAAPEPEGPIRLIQPKVRYRFEDPALQSLSAGHKIMVRMGVENSRRIKAKLTDIRRRLTEAAGAR